MPRRRRLRPARARPRGPRASTAATIAASGTDRGSASTVIRPRSRSKPSRRFAADDRSDLAAQRRDLFGAVHAGDAKRARPSQRTSSSSSPVRMRIARSTPENEDLAVAGSARCERPRRAPSTTGPRARRAPRSRAWSCGRRHDRLRRPGLPRPRGARLPPAEDLRHGEARQSSIAARAMQDVLQHERLNDGLDFAHGVSSYALRSRLRLRRAGRTRNSTVGRTNRVSSVDVTRPPITTVASGRCTSAPALDEAPSARSRARRPARSSAPAGAAPVAPSRSGLVARRGRARGARRCRRPARRR